MPQLQLPLAGKIERSPISLIDRPSVVAIQRPNCFTPFLEEALAENFQPDYRSHPRSNLGHREGHSRRTPEPRATAPARIWTKTLTISDPRPP